MAGDPYAARGPARTGNERQAATPPEERLPDVGLAGEVPEGTVDDVAEWVGTDPDRAQAALLVERAQPDPRKTLVARMEAVLRAADA